LLLEHLPLESSSPDESLRNAITFVITHQANRAPSLPVTRKETGTEGSSKQVPLLDLSFVPDDWWERVTGEKKRSALVTHVDHRYLEMCVLHQAAEQLQAGDMFIPLGDKYRDYRHQLISPEEYKREVVSYSEQMNVPIDGKAAVARLRSALQERARTTDQSIPSKPSYPDRKRRTHLEPRARLCAANWLGAIRADDEGAAAAGRNSRCSD
jgi:hypothetical protein